MLEQVGRGGFCKVNRAMIKFDDLAEPEEYAVKIYNKNDLKNTPYWIITPDSEPKRSDLYE